MRFLLSWRRSEEKVFTTDVSLCGIFLRTSVVPPPGSEITIELPEARPSDECIKLVCKVVRVVRRGDPYNPLGGVGVELVRINSPRGTGPALELMTLLMGGKEPPHLPIITDEVAVSLPDCRLLDLEPKPVEEEVGFENKRAHTRTVAVHLAVFCRWRNMIIQAALKRLGSEQAILSNLKVVPEIGDEVVVRLLGITESRFRGLQFTGRVDQVMPMPDANDSLVSLALDPAEQQAEIGGLRAFLRSVSPGVVDEDEDE